MTINRIVKLIFLVFLVTAGLAAALVTAQDDADVQAKIENAMSAAPIAIAEGATILDYRFIAQFTPKLANRGS